ncbi:Uncharacterised protein [Mycobacteroides abscessus subsp. abscessus]|nr:Uncharacterised protein [Mycobacteroides abscessus subsp. abscessus]
MVQIFWPFSCQPPSTLVARRLSEATSDPASGSLNSWHQISSPRSAGPARRSSCAGVPRCNTIGTTH